MPARVTALSWREMRGCSTLYIYILLYEYKEKKREIDDRERKNDVTDSVFFLHDYKC